MCARLRQAGHDVTCRIVGGGAPAVHALLARRIAAAGLAGTVELTGPLALADVYRAMREADVFVLLSEVGVNGLRDGFPTVLLEAMALRLPVVSTWISGIPEIVRHEVTGYLVPERQPRAAAAAIGRLAGDAALRARFGPRDGSGCGTASTWSAAPTGWRGCWPAWGGRLGEAR